MTDMIVKKMYFINREDVEPELSISYLLLDNEDINYLFTEDEDYLISEGHLQIKAERVDVNSCEYKIAEQNSNLRYRNIPQDFIEHLIQKFKDCLSNC